MALFSATHSFDITGHPPEHVRPRLSFILASADRAKMTGDLAVRYGRALDTSFWTGRPEARIGAIMAATEPAGAEGTRVNLAASWIPLYDLGFALSIGFIQVVVPYLTGNEPSVIVVLSVVLAVFATSLIRSGREEKWLKRIESDLRAAL
jgi:hypothetical protein